MELTNLQKQAVSMGIVVDTDHLHQVSEPIGEIEDTELFKLIDKMERTLIATRGVGLAAIQIGIPKQIFVMLDPNGGIETVINPEIKKAYWQKVYITEGCLSLPDEKQFAVGRPKKLTVGYMSIRNGKPKEVERTFEEFYATVFAHEFSHLRGKTYIDKEQPV